MCWNGSLAPAGTYDVAITDLHELIQETVNPQDWREAGGSLGSIRVFGGRFIIVGSPDTQAKVGALLESIRTGRGDVRVP